ncbi:uncharacterized protein LOC134530080 [Bacillus rossius redtenbacheri]|uniref:uncharacterized protein LOC134530080 n=1 Tax=Bacillus rossius redtenbacheri TaxID=93214 RepID=UPI002FDE58EE
MEERIEKFKSAVTLVFDNWTALRLAAEHNVGLPRGRDLALQFVDHVVEVFSRGGMAWEEAADMLEDAMDGQFETICDDDSPEQVGALLCRLHRLCAEGGPGAVEAELSRLPRGQPWLTVPPVSKEETPAVSQAAQSVKAEGMEVTEEEWTQVKGRRKKENFPL